MPNMAHHARTGAKQSFMGSFPALGLRLLKHLSRGGGPHPAPGAQGGRPSRPRRCTLKKEEHLSRGAGPSRPRCYARLQAQHLIGGPGPPGAGATPI